VSLKKLAATICGELPACYVSIIQVKISV